MEIKEEPDIGPIEEEMDLTTSETGGAPDKPQRLEEKPGQVASKSHKCARHLGYLSQRSSKEQIPEECILCEDIVKCMLKGVTD